MSNVQPVLADPKHIAPITSASDLHDSLKPSNPLTDAPATSIATDTNSGTHAGAQQTVMFRSDKMPADTPICRGYDFNNGIDYDAIFRAYATTGFQATNMSLAMEQINQMIRWRQSDEPLPDGETEEEQPVDRSTVRCTIFLGYTSNMISCGVRETIRYLCQHKMVDAIVTSAGGVEEDFMKCLAPHYMGDFKLDGKGLRIRGFNRIGNLLVPNTNYCAFEEWINPILDEMVREQVEEKKVWSPSSMIARFGRDIKNEESVYYWCYKNNIPVFCPALTDGSIGDMIYFHGSSNTPLIVDIAQDIRALNDIALLADKSGMIILGGGTPKHQICNANLMRNGADYSVYINTGVDWDGSDSGAAPDEAVSWGKIKVDAKPVKVNGDASLIFPLVVSQTFAKHKAMYDELNNPNKKKAAPRIVKF